MLNLKQKAILLQSASLSLLFAIAPTIAIADDGVDDKPADKWVHTPTPQAPISVKLKLNSDKPLISGLFAKHVYVVIRNDSKDKAVAVRNVRWWEGGRESLDWHGSIYGSTVQYEKGEVAVVLNELTQSLTSLAFEKGLLLPGDELKVHMPFTPQRYANNTLQVEYITVGDDENPWYEQVLIPGPAPASLRVDYVRLSAPDDVGERKGRGGRGLVLSTMDQRGKSPQVKKAIFDVPVPIEKEADPKLTDGLTFMQAAWRAGAANEDEGYLGYYLPKIKTWFFIRGDGSVRTLRPKGDDWTFDFGKNMPAWVPDYFGRGEEKTAILLNPEIFGDIVKVQTPWQQMYYNPGLTQLDADELWQVLQLVNRKLGLEVESVVINPNGLGKARVLTIGVKVDSSGKWIKPAIEPREVPLNPR